MDGPKFGVFAKGWGEFLDIFWGGQALDKGGCLRYNKATPPGGVPLGKGGSVF